MKKILLIFGLLIIVLSPTKLLAKELNEDSLDGIKIEKYYKYYVEKSVPIGYFAISNLSNEYEVNINDYIYSTYSYEKPRDNDEADTIVKKHYSYYKYKPIKYILFSDFKIKYGELLNIYELDIFYEKKQIPYTIDMFDGIYGQGVYELSDDSDYTYISLENYAKLRLDLGDNIYDPSKLTIKITTDNTITSPKNYQLKTIDENETIITTNYISELNYTKNNTDIPFEYDIDLSNSITTTQDSYSYVLTTVDLIDDSTYVKKIEQDIPMYRYKLYKHNQVVKEYLPNYYLNYDEPYIKDENIYEYHYSLINNEENSLKDVQENLFTSINLINDLNKKIDLLEGKIYKSNFNSYTSLEKKLDGFVNLVKPDYYTKTLGKISDKLDTIDINKFNNYYQEIDTLKSQLTIVSNKVNDYPKTDDEPLITYEDKPTNKRGINILYAYGLIFIITIVITSIYIKKQIKSS